MKKTADIPGLQNEVTLGSGTLFLSDNGVNWDDMGYVSACGFQVATETKEVNRPKGGLQTTAKKIAYTISATGSFTADIPTLANLKNFFYGDQISKTDVASGSVTDEAIASSKIVLDKYADLGYYDLSNVVIKADTSQLTEGTDYVIDRKYGMLSILSSNSQGISDGDSTITLTADHASHTIHQIVGASAKQIKRHVYFQGDPPHGKCLVIKGYATIEPNSEFGLISQEPLSLQFNITFEAHSNYENLIIIEDHGTVA